MSGPMMLSQKVIPNPNVQNTCDTVISSIWTLVHKIFNLTHHRNPLTKMLNWYWGGSFCRFQKLKGWFTANSRYARHTIDYRQTHGSAMLPFRSVLDWFCVSWDFLLYLGQPSTTINHSVPNIWPWPWSLTLTFEFDLTLQFDLMSPEKVVETWHENTMYHALTLKFDLWSWATIPT